MDKINDDMYKTLKYITDILAFDICRNHEDENWHWLDSPRYRRKVQSVILESMSTSKVWKNDK